MHDTIIWDLKVTANIFPNSRCGRFIALDGYTRGVSYDDEDEFCLDGQRLVPVLENTEYRTEIDSYRKVTVVGSTGQNNPDAFKVQTKDHKIMHYGSSPNSKIIGIGQNVTHAWLLSSVSDYNGNKIELSYLDGLNGFYISKLAYKTKVVGFKSKI